MGAKQSVQFSDEALKTFNKEYTLEKTIDDARFGKAQIFKNNNGVNKVIVTSRVFATKNELNTFAQTIQARLENFSHPNLLTVMGYQETANKNLCSQMNKFSLYFEYLRRDLASEIKARAETKDLFTEEEAWYLVSSILSAVEYLHSKNLVHGAIHPANVLVNGEGEVKLYDNDIISTKNIFNKTNCFQAPEELEGLVNGNLDSVDQAKADLFAIGLTLLEILSLRDVKTLVYEENKINKNGIAELAFQAKRHYSPALVDLALRLISEKPENRIALSNANNLRNTIFVAPVARPVVAPLQIIRNVSVPQVAPQVVEQVEKAE